MTVESRSRRDEDTSQLDNLDAYLALLWPHADVWRQQAAVTEQADDRSVRVLGDFQVLVGGKVVSLSLPTRRVIAYLAVQGGGPVRRPVVAAALWPERDENCARVNLRQALAYERRSRWALIDASYETLSLCPSVVVDMREALDSARSVLVGDIVAVDPSLFLNDLLPDWDEAWLVVAREHFQQLRLRCLEELARRWLERGRPGPAVAAAQAALASDPLRETAQTLMVQAYLAEGNRAQALRQYDSYRADLQRVLGLEPSEELKRLLSQEP